MKTNMSRTDSSQLSTTLLRQHQASHSLTNALLELFAEVINNLWWIIPPDSKSLFERCHQTQRFFSAIYLKIFNLYQKNKSFDDVSEIDAQYYIGCAEQLMNMNKYLSAHLIKVLKKLDLNSPNNLIALLENPSTEIIKTFKTEFQTLLKSVKKDSLALTLESAKGRKAVRLQRSVNLKLFWLRQLRKQFESCKEPQTLLSKINFLDFINKKSFILARNLKMQSASSILSTLYLKLKHREGNIQSVLDDLNEKIFDLEIEIQKTEQVDFKDLTFPEKFLFQIGLLLKTLLDNSLGNALAEISNTFTNGLVKDPWPASWTPYIKYTSVAVCLAMDSTFMSWIGTSYYLTQTLSQTALIYQRHWTPLTDKLDIAICSRQSFDFLRTDEIGILEKQKIIQWMLSLLIHLSLFILFNFNYLILSSMGIKILLPPTIGYCLSTIMRNLAHFTVVNLGRFRRWHPHTIELLNRVLSLLSTIVSYPIGTNVTHAYLLKNLNQNESLKILGLNSNADSSQIRKQYLFLVKELHPDKCKTCDPNHFRAVESAYKILKTFNSRKNL